MRWVLMALAAARATRFVTTDKLGEWTVSGPLVRWAWLHDGPGRTDASNLDAVRQWEAGMVPLPLPEAWWGWRSKLVNGLDCPFCVGFWVGAVVLLSELVAGRARVWRFGRNAFALNYVVGHLSKRIDK